MDLKEFSILQSAPGLRELFLKETWKKSFRPRILALAAQYSSRDRLLSCHLIESSPDEFIVEAEFRGFDGKIVDTEVAVEFSDLERRDYAIYLDCSCSNHFACEHAAALFLHLGELTKHQLSPASSGRLDPETQAWLHTLDDAKDAPSAPEESTPVNRFLSYCIKPSRFPHAPLELSLHIGRRLQSGEIRIDTGSNANADPLNPQKYMCQEDLLPCTLFRQGIRSAYHFRQQSQPLAGAAGHALLTACLQTDRLFFLSDFDDLAPIQPGPTIQVAPSWQSDSDGSLTPSLGLPPGAFLIPTAPLFALVPARDHTHPHATLHPVASPSHSDSFLTIWHRGPSIPAPAVAELTTRLTGLSIPIPAPPAVKRETLPKVRPVPRLTLHRKNPFAHRGLHLSGQPEPIVAELSFLYHGHPAPVAHQSGKLPNLSVAKDETILSIPRHKTGELEVIQTLRTTLGVVHAPELDPVLPKNFGCFLPNSSPRHWDLEWARIIASNLPELEKLGWQIEVDTSAHIELHAIGPDNLDTGLAELPDHGIDWFQFDASYLTPAGEKQSLLPLLTAYLQTIDPNSIPENLAALGPDDLTILKDPASGKFVSISTQRLLTLVKSIHDLFGHSSPDTPLHRIQAADLADSLELDHSATLRALAELGRNLKSITTLPKPRVPKSLTATLRDYQLDGFHWMQFLARHSLHGILADDMGLGKTLQALTHLQAEVSGRRTNKRPSLVVAPTSVVGNWASEARKFAPKLKVLTLHGPERKEQFPLIPRHHLVLTSYALLLRDFDQLKRHQYHLLILDEAQYIKNPASQVSQLACQLTAAHRLSLSGTPLENHLGELWSQLRFLMPGLLGSSEKFRKTFRTPIEKHHDSEAQALLNRRVAPLLLRRTKDQVATELPPKTEIIHSIALHPKQIDLYETVRAAMDKRIRDAIAEKGLAKSHIIVLDALLKLRQICCHPQLLKLTAAQKTTHSAKLDFLAADLLPTLLEEGRKILLFSSFTSMLALIEQHLDRKRIPFAKIIGSTRDRQAQIERFQSGDAPIFLISLKAGGTGLNLTAADTVIHYDPWWNPAAENQATDRAHRIGQDKPVFVHKLIAEGTIEQRIQSLQSQKAALVEALLTDDTNRLRIDPDTLNNLLAPLQ